MKKEETEQRIKE